MTKNASIATTLMEFLVKGENFKEMLEKFFFNCFGMGWGGGRGGRRGGTVGFNQIWVSRKLLMGVYIL